MLFKYLMTILVIVIALFIPSGTIYYWNGWLFAGLLFIPMLMGGVFLYIKCPELLEKRLNSKEKEDEQKNVQILSAISLISIFVSAGLDFQFGWSSVPLMLVFTASAFFIVAYVIYFEVLRENAFLSRTVELQENQKVIDSGLYSLVRHPMYFSVTLLCISMTLVLGSWVSFICALPMVFILVKRINNEEEVLKNGLKGYKEYTKRVRYRLIPFVW